MVKNTLVYIQMFIIMLTVINCQHDCICGLFRDKFSFSIDYKYHMTNSYIYSIVEDIVLQYQKFHEVYQLPRVFIHQIEDEVIGNDKRTGSEMISRDSIQTREQDKIFKKYVLLSFENYTFKIQIGDQKKNFFLRSKILFESNSSQNDIKKRSVDQQYTSLEFNPSNQKRGFIYYSVCQHFLMFLRKYNQAIIMRYDQLDLEQQSLQNSGMNIENKREIINKQVNVWKSYQNGLKYFSARQYTLQSKSQQGLTGCVRDIEFDERKQRKMAFMDLAQFTTTNTLYQNGSKIVTFKRKIQGQVKKKKKSNVVNRLYQPNTKPRTNQNQTNVGSVPKTKKQSQKQTQNMINRLTGGSSAYRSTTNQQRKKKTQNQTPVVQINLDMDTNNQKQQRLQTNEFEFTQISQNLPSQSDEQSYSQDDLQKNIIYEHTNQRQQVQPLIQDEIVSQSNEEDLDIIMNEYKNEYQESMIAVNLNFYVKTLEEEVEFDPGLSPEKKKLFDYFLTLISDQQDLLIINLLYQDFMQNKKQKNPNESVSAQEKNSLLILFEDAFNLDQYIYEIFELRKAGFFIENEINLQSCCTLLYNSSIKSHSFQTFYSQISQQNQTQFDQDILAYISYFVQLNIEYDKQIKILKVYKNNQTGQLFTNLQFNFENIKINSLIYESIIEDGYIGCAEELTFEQSQIDIYQIQASQTNVTTGQTFEHFNQTVYGNIISSTDQGIDYQDKESFLKFIKTLDPSVQNNITQIEQYTSEFNVQFNGQNINLNSETKRLKEYEEFLENFDIFDFTKKRQQRTDHHFKNQGPQYDQRNDQYLEYYTDHEILDLIPDLSNPLINTMVDPVNRTRMIDWFIRIQMSLKMERFYDVIFRAICLFDCFMKFSKKMITDTELYPYGATILFIANKYELIHPFSINDYCQLILCNNFHPKVISKIEFQIIKSLNFKFVYTTYYEIVSVLLTKFFNHRQSLKFEEFQNLTSHIMLICMYDQKFNNFDQLNLGIASIFISIEIFFTEFNKKKAKKYNKDFMLNNQKKFINSIMKNFNKEQISIIKKLITKIKRHVEKVYQHERASYMCGPLLDKLLQKMFK